jgi:hypothetical protein
MVCPIFAQSEISHKRIIYGEVKRRTKTFSSRGERAQRGIRSSLPERKVRHQRHTMAPAVVRWAQERAIQLKVILYKNFKVSVLAILFAIFLSLH